MNYLGTLNKSLLYLHYFFLIKLKKITYQNKYLFFYHTIIQKIFEKINKLQYNANGILI